MLKNIDPLLGPDLLSLLRAMGHRQAIAVVDRNYPSLGAGRAVVRLEDTTAPRALEALLSVLPLDNAPDAVVRMEVRGRPDEVLPVMHELIDTVHRHAPDHIVASVPALEFQARAATAVAIVVTGECRKYGNIIVRKGILPA
jgi:L-fucose mutarotase